MSGDTSEPRAGESHAEGRDEPPSKDELLSWEDVREGMLVDVRSLELDLWISTIVHERGNDRIVFGKIVKDEFGQRQFFGLPVERTSTGGFIGVRSEFQVRRTLVERVKETL